MAWPIRILSNEEREAKRGRYEPGDAWFAPWWRQVGRLSLRYHREGAAKRDRTFP